MRRIVYIIGNFENVHIFRIFDTKEVFGMEKTLQKYIESYLKRNCVGTANSIYSGELESMTGLRGPELRRCINGLRENGVPICSGPTGYYYAATREDVLATISNLRGRVHSIVRAADGLEAALADYEPPEPECDCSSNEAQDSTNLFSMLEAKKGATSHDPITTQL